MQTSPSQNRWWKGSRGEWYVAAQGMLLLLVAVGPRTIAGLPLWSGLIAKAALIIGFIFIPAGTILVIWGMRALGNSLTPLPYPKDTGVLVESGPYRIVRHPIYSGLIAASFGWGMLVHGWLTLGIAVLLFVLLDIKSRREEQWLLDRFQGYPEYRKRVKKLVPFIY
jgi:protein-S-isoprenylcysteine O-methyltransferase Ste14